MRNLVSLLATTTLLATQVASPLSPIATAPIQAQAGIGGTTTAQLTYSTASPALVEYKAPTADFETEVLNPLRAAQAVQAAKAKAEAEAAAKAARLAAEAQARALAQARAAAPRLTASGPLSPQQITYLGNCESGMTANRNSGNGYYGAFQFSISTWNAMKTGYGRADMAPLDVQIDAVQRLLSRSSIYTQFPGCARKMQAAGLL